jgi:hypothetical protein
MPAGRRGAKTDGEENAATICKAYLEQRWKRTTVRILSLCMRRHTGKAAFLHEVTDDIDCCGAHTWIGAA